MFARLSVRRPVTIGMVYIGLVLLGVIGFMRLPQEFFPPISFPQLTIKTSYKDAAPEEIEMLITKPIEEIVGTVSGLKRISSVSKEEVSLVIAEFNWGTHMDFAALHVREKIDLIKERLPRGAEEPIVLKYNPFEKPALVLNVTGKRSPYRLLELCKKQIKAELEKVEGVAACVLRGGREREILVEIDQDELEASGVSITHLSEALKKSNVNFPAGTIEEEFYEYLVRTMGEFKVVPEIPRTVVGVDRLNVQPGWRMRMGNMSEDDRKDMQEKQEASKRLIFLKDIARVRDTFKEKTSFSRFNGQDTVSLSIQKQAGSFTLRVVKNVLLALRGLRMGLPKDIKISVSFDQSILISNAIKGVAIAGLEGAIIAFFVLLFFLRRLLSAFVVTLTIFLSVLITFFLMYVMKLSLNMISLGGLALGIGMLVDNGIVVVENIARHRHLGKHSREASIDGSNEVTGAIFSSTLTTIAVFFPMIFVIGVVGQIFKQLAFTITGSLVASFFAAVTFIPMIISILERKHIVHIEDSQEEKKEGILLRIFGKLVDVTLKLFLRFRFMSLFLIVLLFLVSAMGFGKLEREFFPKIDQGQFSVKLTMPSGTKIAVTDRVGKKIEDAILSFEAVQFISSTGGSQEGDQAAEAIQTMSSNQAEFLVTLKQLARWGTRLDVEKNRKISTRELVQKLKQKLTRKVLEGGEVEYNIQETEFAAAFQTSSPVVLEISGADLKKLEEIALGLQKNLKSIQGLYGIKNSIVPPSPETKIHINKDRASQYELTVSDISLAAQTAIKGNVSTKLKEEGKEIDIRVRLKKEDRDTVSKIRRLMVTSRLGVNVPLAEVAYLAVGKGPTEIKRLSQQRIVMVFANIYKRGLQEVFVEVQQFIDKMKLPVGYTVRLTGEREQMQDSFKSLLFALILSLLAVYMIMAAQFESLWQPFVIFFTFPLSIIGVVIILFLTKTPVGVMVFLGIIVLGGVVVNNGIVLIDFVNRLREKGMSAEEAVIQASQVRLRPIVMTALTTILGLTPLALALGEGTDIQKPMAITVMGGLTISTFLSLVVIPTIYVSVDHVLVGLSRFVTKLKGAAGVEEDEEEFKSFDVTEEESFEAVGVVTKAEEKAVEEKEAAEEDAEDGSSTGQTPDIGHGPGTTEDSGLGVEELNERQQKALDYIREHGKISRIEYVRICKTSIATASRDLKDLVKRGFIEGHGPMATGRYYTLK